jgi:membrane protein implicated in regulation of membrane protease activity
MFGSEAAVIVAVVLLLAAWAWNVLMFILWIPYALFWLIPREIIRARREKQTSESSDDS